MKSRGNITVALAFILLMAFIGLSLLTFTLTHSKISAARAKKILETERIFQDLYYHLHHFKEKIFNEDITAFNQPELEYFNNTYFPDQQVGDSSITNSFCFIEKQEQTYKNIRIMNTIDAAAGKHNYRVRAGAEVNLLCGKIPLTAFPLFINQGIDKPVDTFLKENNIVHKPDQNVVINDMETELDVNRLLLDSLKIEGTSLTWAKIREKFGFEVSDKPIEEGIYLLVEEDRVESIFIQGDVERIIFSVQDTRQKICIMKNGIAYDLGYQPEGSYFQCWDPQIDTASIFKETIVVNGSAWSIEQSGNAAFLGNSNIKLHISGQAVITSNLQTEGFDLKKTTLNNLTLISSSKGLPGPLNPDAGISIDADKEEVKVQAALITDGKFENRCSRADLSGSLFAKDLENNGVLEISHLNSKFDAGQYFTTTDFKYISQFSIPYIEEVYDEN